MSFYSGNARIAAGLIALLIWVGLAVQFSATFEQNASIVQTLWILVHFFTVLTNFLAALVLTGIALGISASNSPVLLAGTTLSMGFVGLTYALLLRGLLELSGGASLANFLLHYASPVLVLLFWLIFAPKGGLRYGNPLLWVIYPLAYAAYALVRGAFGGKYAYPFIDVAQIGGMQTSINVVFLAVSFLAAGFAMVWLDGMLGRRNLA